MLTELEGERGHEDANATATAEFAASFLAEGPAAPLLDDASASDAGLNASRAVLTELEGERGHEDADWMRELEVASRGYDALSLKLG